MRKLHLQKKRHLLFCLEKYFTLCKILNHQKNIFSNGKYSSLITYSGCSIKEYPNSIAGNHAYAALGALTNNFDAAIKHIQHIHDKVTNRHGIETYKLESDVHLLKVIFFHQ